MYSSTQQVDDMWDDYFAAGDAIRERYAAELADLKADDLAQEAHDEYMNRVWESGFGSDWFAYEEYWKRLDKYAQDHYPEERNGTENE